MSASNIPAGWVELAENQADPGDLLDEKPAGQVVSDDADGERIFYSSPVEPVSTESEHTRTDALLYERLGEETAYQAIPQTCSEATNANKQGFLASIGLDASTIACAEAEDDDDASVGPLEYVPFNALTNSEQSRAVQDYLDTNKDGPIFRNLFQRYPYLIGRCLETIDDDDDQIYDFLTRHQSIVGIFLEQQKDITVLADFLDRYPAALRTILDEEPAIVENFLRDRPEALQVYLDANSNVLDSYYRHRPSKFRRSIVANPQLLSNFCDKHPHFMVKWLQNRQKVVQDYLLANPALFWNHLVAHPSCVSAGQALNEGKLTMSLLHDIPEDQKSLIRLPVKWALPNSPTSRTRVLKELATRGEGEIAIHGSSQLGSTIANYKTFTDARLAQLLGEEEDTWENGGTEAVPASLERCTCGNLQITGSRRDSKVPNSNYGQQAPRSVFQELQPYPAQRPNFYDPPRPDKVTKTPPSNGQPDCTEKANDLITGVDLDIEGNNHETYETDPEILLQQDEMFGVFESEEESDSFVQSLPKHQEACLTAHIHESASEDDSESPIGVVRKNKHCVQKKVGKAAASTKKACGGEYSSDDNNDAFQDASSSEEHDDDSDSSFGQSSRKAKSGKSKYGKRTSWQAVRKSNHKSSSATGRSGKSTRRAIVVSDSEDEDDQQDESDPDAESSGDADPSGSSNSTITTVSADSPARALVPYPADDAALALDALKKRSAREWSLREEDCGIKHMLAIRDEDRLKGEVRFAEAARRVSVETGTNRTQNSFKNFWNRTGRARSGFDERKNKTAPLATSQQGRKSNSPRNRAQKRKSAELKNMQDTAAASSTGDYRHSSQPPSSSITSSTTTYWKSGPGESPPKSPQSKATPPRQTFSPISDEEKADSSPLNGDVEGVEDKQSEDDAEGNESPAASNVQPSHLDVDTSDQSLTSTSEPSESISMSSNTKRKLSKEDDGDCFDPDTQTEANNENANASVATNREFGYLANGVAYAKDGTELYRVPADEQAAIEAALSGTRSTRDRKRVRYT